MLAERDGRWMLKCNECPIRMDLAPAVRPKETLRMPTGWIDLGDGAHVCQQCARSRWIPNFRR
jgi:hypothetical protein